MTTEVNQDQIIENQIDFQQVINEGKELHITYNPLTRDIHVVYEDKYIHAREVSVLMTEHSGAQIKIRTQDPELEQSNGGTLISAHDIFIDNPSLFVSSLVLKTSEKENQDSTELNNNGDNES